MRTRQVNYSHSSAGRFLALWAAVVLGLFAATMVACAGRETNIAATSAHVKNRVHENSGTHRNSVPAHATEASGAKQASDNTLQIKINDIVSGRVDIIDASQFATAGEWQVFCSIKNDKYRQISAMSNDDSLVVQRMDASNLPDEKTQNRETARVEEKSENSCYALKSDGTVWSSSDLGQNHSQQGKKNAHRSSQVIILTPAKDDTDSPMNQVKTLAVSTSGSVYAVRLDSSLWVAGHNPYRQLGIGGFGFQSNFTPALTVGGDQVSNVESVTVGKGSNKNSVLVLLRNGTVLMAGENASYFGVSAFDTIGGDIAPKFAVIRNPSQGKPLAGVVALSQQEDLSYLHDAAGRILRVGSSVSN